MSSCKTKSNSFLHLPQDIIEDILLRLPPKSLIKFSCLSKQCKSIIFDPKFVLHYKTSYASDLRGLFYPFIQSIIRSSWQRPYKYAMDCKELKRPHLGKLDGLLFYLTKFFSLGHKIVASSNGLVLSLISPKLDTFEYWVTNPLTKQSVRLPPVTCEKSQWQSGFATRQTEINGAYHLSYKVVLFSSDMDSIYCTAQIFSSDSGRWTSPRSALQKLIRNLKSGQDFCRRGVMYWCNNDSKTIVTYDPYDAPDRFRSIRLPYSGSDNTVISLVQPGFEDSVRYCTIKQDGDISTLLVWRLVEGELWLQRRCEIPVQSWFLGHSKQLVAARDTITYLYTRQGGQFSSIDLRRGEQMDYKVDICGGVRSDYEDGRLGFVPVVFCPWSSPLYCQLN